MRFVVVVLFCSWLLSPLFSQTPVVDSLRTRLATAPDSLRFQTLRQLASEFAYVDRDSAQHYLEVLTAFAEREGTERQRGVTILLKANAAYDRGHYDRADSLSLDAAAKFRALQDTAALARAILNVGSVADAAGEKTRAITYYLTAIEYFDALGDTLNVAYTQLNVGLTFKSLGEFEKALHYYAIAQRQLVHVGDAFGLATVNNNTGSLLLELERYDSAYYYAAQSRQQYDDLDYGLYAQFSAHVMAEAAEQLGRPKEALELLLASVPILEDNEAQEDLFTAYRSLARLHTGRGNHQEASRYAQLSLELAQQTKSFEDLRDAYEVSYKHHAATGNMEAALPSLEAFKQYSDSVSSVAKSKQINELETRYRTAEQERQLAEQRFSLAEQEALLGKRNSQLLGLGLGLVVLLSLALLGFQRSRAKARERLNAKVLTEREKGLRAVVAATEEERRRVSRELHDGIGQQLTAVRLGLEAVSRETANNSTLNSLLHQFAQSAEEVRQLSHQMMPRSLMERGLVPAIEDLLHQSFSLQRSANGDTTQVQFDHRGVADERLPEPVELTYYRVLQELINNIQKHAEASLVEVQLYRTAQRLVLRVEDNGVGFVFDQEGEHHGLLNVRQRLQLLGGQVHWTSTVGEGTSATASLNL